MARRGLPAHEPLGALPERVLPDAPSRRAARLCVMANRSTPLRWLTLAVAAVLALIASAPGAERWQWRPLGPGGGGALFHPTVSPHDPRTALIACDMTGNYITTDAGGHWRNFNLGAPVEFFLF